MSAGLLLALAGPAWSGTMGVAEAPLDEVYAPRRVAVLVGVDHYDDPELPRLRFAGKDANDLADVLEAPELGGFDRVVVLTGGDQTTAARITEAIDIATSDLQRDDTFLLYLSGHGTLTLDAVDGTSLWFLPSDGQLSSAPSTGMAVDWLEERVSQVPARRRVMILDTCHNGREKSLLAPDTAQLLAGMRGEPPAPRRPAEVSESEARLFAAQYYQPALEDPDLENGVYTHYLIQALSTRSAQADLSGDGLVDVAEAHDWARDRTISHTGGIQVPRAEYRIVGREEIYLAGDPSQRTGAEKALLAATDALLAQASLLVDGIPRGALPDVVAVEPGAHQIELIDDQGRTLLARRVRVSAGETVMVEDLFNEPRFEMVVGGLYRTGEGAGYMGSRVPELELAWIDPWSGPRWFSSDLHVRSSVWRGEVIDQPWGADQVATGNVAIGAHLGAHLGPVRLGPVLEFDTLWRRFTDAEGLQNQGNLAPSAGLRASTRLPVGSDLHLTLRYDSRVTPWIYDGDWSWMAGHSLGLGFGF